MWAAGGWSLLLSGDGLFQKWRHCPIRSCHLAPVCSYGSSHTLLRHLEVPLCPATQSGSDLQMTALTNDLTRSSSCVLAASRGSSCELCPKSEAASFGKEVLHLAQNKIVNSQELMVHSDDPLQLTKSNKSMFITRKLHLAGKFVTTQRIHSHASCSVRLHLPRCLDNIMFFN